MTQEFALYIDENTIKRPVRHLRTPQCIAFNFDKNIELMKSMGYCELREDEKPEYDETTTYLRPQYELCSETIQEENDEGQFVDVNQQYIQVHWVETEIEEEANED